MRVGHTLQWYESAPLELLTSTCAACRAAAAKPDVQAHRLELSDEDSKEDLDVDGVEIEQDGAAIDNASPIAELEIAKEVRPNMQHRA